MNVDITSDWFKNERLKDAAIDAATELIVDEDSLQASIGGSGGFFFEYMCFWYVHMHDKTLITGVATATADYLEHLVDSHGMPKMLTPPMSNVLMRFSALVITKCGGRLV